MTNMIAWSLLIAGAILSTVSSLLMRYGGSSIPLPPDFWVILHDGKLWVIGMAIGWLSGIAYALALTRLPLTKAAVFYVPLVYVTIVLGGIFILNEDISFMKKIGVGIITIGLIVCARS